MATVKIDAAVIREPLFEKVEALNADHRHENGGAVLPHRNGVARDRATRVKPVVPIKLGSGRYEVISVPRKGEYDASFSTGSAAAATKLSKDEAVAEASELTSGWGTSLPARKSLYRAIVTHDYTAREAIAPRGLTNNKNMCFFNAVLQALVHCEPFYALLADIRKSTTLKIKSNTPILDGLISFAAQYALGTLTTDMRRLMSAEEFYKVICSNPSFGHLQPGRQEDAQEFLSLLFDTLELNFDAAEPSEDDDKDVEASYSEFVEEREDDGWTEVGKNSRPIKAVNAGRQDYNNPILELFGGRFRSILRRRGRNPSVTADPFQQVPLDISSPEVNSIQEAVQHMLAEEQLSLENGATAAKQLEFDRTPPILILHLKRFTFIRKGNELDFGKITKSIVINDQIEAGGALYRVFAIVYHHGSSTTMGHYTTDVLVDGDWYSIDDDHVSLTQRTRSESPAFRTAKDGESQREGHGSASAYIVFYERLTIS